MHKLLHKSINSSVCSCVFTHLAFGTHEAAHVLHHTNDGQLHLLTESDLFPYVLQRHFLFREEMKMRKQSEKGGVHLANAANEGCECLPVV